MMNLRQRPPTNLTPVTDAPLMSLEEASEKMNAVASTVSEHVIGQSAVVSLSLASIIADGHVLLQSRPGLAKTTLVTCFSQALGLETNRIQFTPDLMPADITGFEMATNDNELKFVEGPIFTQMLMADEINRGTPRTQSALLEGMQEKRVSADGKRYDLPQPFLVMATQNPIEQEGTYPLPEAQLDRFLIRADMEDVPKEDARRILRMTTSGSQEINITPVLSQDFDGFHELKEIQNVAETIAVPDTVEDYILDLSEQVRGYSETGAPSIKEAFEDGGSGLRGAQSLLKLARANALLDNRGVVTMDNVQNMIVPTYIHRLTRKAGVTIDESRETLTKLSMDLMP